MFAALFDKSPLLLYPLAGLIIFMTIFAAAVIRAFRQPRAEREARARLPLDDGEGAQP